MRGAKAQKANVLLQISLTLGECNGTGVLIAE